MDIAVKEALALDKVLVSLSFIIRSARVDAHVDNQAVVHAWNNHGGRGPALLSAIKKLFLLQSPSMYILH